MRIVTIATLVCAGAACGPAPLQQTQPSPDALARAVLSVLQQRDETQLRALAITEREFEEWVWPALPAARPERNLPWSYVWTDLRQKSDRTLKRTIAEHGGRLYTLEQVKFAGKSSDHGRYRVFRESVLVVRDAAGEQRELNLLGSMVEVDGAWKVFSYVVDQ